MTSTPSGSGWPLSAPAMVVLSALGLALAGCDSGPKLSPASGQVLIDGQPLKYGGVRVMPEDGPSAYGQIEADGRFKLMTNDQEGCIDGTHPVEVNATEPISEYKYIEHAPKKYASSATSGLTVTIDGPTDALKIELVSKKGK